MVNEIARGEGFDELRGKGEDVVLKLRVHSTAVVFGFWSLGMWGEWEGERVAVDYIPVGLCKNTRRLQFESMAVARGDDSQ